MNNDIVERLKLKGIPESTIKAVFEELLKAASKNDSIPSIPNKNYTAPVRPVNKICDPSGLRVIRDVMNVDMDYLDTGDPNVKCYYRTLLETNEAPHFMPVTLEIDHSSFEWYCGYSELDYVVEGTLELTIDGRKQVLKPGDVSLIPMRSTVIFGSPDHCKVLAIVYPTNWGDYCI